MEANNMPRNENIEKILVIGSGPIVIGQAAEFDYSGTQACHALKEEGYEVILANSNPATIMTDFKIGRAHVLNSSHVAISYAVFCLKKKKNEKDKRQKDC